MLTFAKSLTAALLHLGFFLAVVVPAFSVAAPTTRSGAEPGRPATAQPSAESPRDKAFRDGVQAQLKGDWVTAKQQFEAALKLAPGFAPALIGLAGVAQHESQPAAARAYLKKAEAAAPKAPEVHLAWGRFHIVQKAPDLAEKALKKSSSLAPNALPPKLELADLQLRLGRNADALKTYREAAAIDDRNKYVAYGLGVAAAAAGQRDEALKALALAAELAPADVAPLQARGRLMLEVGDQTQALAEFDRGLARQPRSVPLMLDRAEVLARRQQWTDAIDQALAAERLAPQAVEVQMKLADVYQGAQRWDEAEVRYRKVMALAPKLPHAYNNLAWMTVARGGDPGKAVGWARQAIGLSPASSPFHDTLGWAQRAAGDLAGATASLKQAIKLEPKVAGYHYHLGVVLAERKIVADARASLRKALELDPKLPQAEQAQSLLAQLGGG